MMKVTMKACPKVCQLKGTLIVSSEEGQSTAFLAALKPDDQLDTFT